jgi:hypothetical protein
MTRLDNWRIANRIAAPTAALRAAGVWAWILRKPDSITIIRGGVAQSTAQTVRIEFAVNVMTNEIGNNSGTSGKRYVTIFGIQGHATQANTDIQRGDKFKYHAAGNLANYEVLSVDKSQIGQIQAIAEELQ